MYIYIIYLHVKHIHTLDIVAYHHGRSPLPSGVRRADHCASRVLMRERSCEKGSSPTWPCNGTSLWRCFGFQKRWRILLQVPQDPQNRFFHLRNRCAWIRSILQGCFFAKHDPLWSRGVLQRQPRRGIAWNFRNHIHLWLQEGSFCKCNSGVILSLPNT